MVATGQPSRAQRIAATATLLLPLLATVVHLPEFGRLPYDDYYAIVHEATEGNRLSTSPWRWLRVSSNEHTVTLPALVYAANIAVTRGDNRGLCVVGVVLLVVQALLLWWGLAAARLPPEPAPRLAGALLCGALLFTPAMAACTVMGFNAVTWFLATLESVAAIVLVARGHAVWPALALAAVGAITFSATLMLWPALLVGTLVMGRPWREPAAVVAGAALVAVVGPVAGHSQIPSPLSLLAGVCAYLGNPFTSSTAAAAAAGAVGLGLAAITAVPIFSRADRLRFAPWWMLQVFVVGNGIATVLRRGGAGLAGTLGSRYVSVVVLFWVATVLALIELAQGLPDRRRMMVRVGALAVAVAATVATFGHGERVLEQHLWRAAGQPLAARAMRLGVPDHQALLAVTPVPSQLSWVVGFLRAVGHVPFADRDQDVEVPPTPPSVGEGADAEAVTPISERWARVDGRHDPGVDVVVLVDAAGAVRARAVTGLPREGRGVRWAAYVERDPEPLRLRVLVRRESAWRRMELAVVIPAATPVSTVPLPDGSTVSLRPDAVVGFKHVVRTADGGLAADGWAADLEHGEPALTVVVLVEGKVVGESETGLGRPDVAEVFHDPRLTYCGFVVTVPPDRAADLDPGSVEVVAVSRHGEASILPTGPG